MSKKAQKENLKIKVIVIKIKENFLIQFIELKLAFNDDSKLSYDENMRQKVDSKMFVY